MAVDAALRLHAVGPAEPGVEADPEREVEEAPILGETAEMGSTMLSTMLALC